MILAFQLQEKLVSNFLHANLKCQKNNMNKQSFDCSKSSNGNTTAISKIYWKLVTSFWCLYCFLPSIRTTSFQLLIDVETMSCVYWVWAGFRHYVSIVDFEQVNTSQRRPDKDLHGIFHAFQRRKKNFLCIWTYSLTLLWQRSLSYRNQPIDLLCKSMNWFLYDRKPIHQY